MADLSHLFGGVPLQPRQAGPFDLAGPKAAEFKRKIAIGEAKKFGLSPQAGDEFYRFMGERLFELGDAEGAQIIEQERMEQSAAKQKSLLEQQKFGLNVYNADTNRMNADTARDRANLELSEAEREAGYTKDLEVVNGKQALVTRDAERKIVDAEAIGGGGTSVSVDVTNVPEGFKPAKTSINKLQNIVIDTGNQLARLQEIDKNFNAGMLSFEGRFGDFWRRGKDYFNAASPEEKAQITRDARFRQTAGNQINMTIKELSGVAVSAQEAKRLQIPEAWYGERNKPWTGMAGTEFKANLRGKLRDIASVHARARYMLKTMNIANGTRFTEQEVIDMAENNSFPVAFEDMPRIMDNRMIELIEAGYEDAQIEQMMMDEFGMIELPRVED